MEKEAAQKEYVKLVRVLSPDYEYDPNVKSTNAMTKTVSRMAQGDDMDQLESFLGLARDDKMQELQDEIINNPNLLKLRDEENRTAIHWAVDREHLGKKTRIFSKKIFYQDHWTSKKGYRIVTQFQQ